MPPILDYARRLQLRSRPSLRSWGVSLLGNLSAVLIATVANWVFAYPLDCTVILWAIMALIGAIQLVVIVILINDVRATPNGTDVVFHWMEASATLFLAVLTLLIVAGILRRARE